MQLANHSNNKVDTQSNNLSIKLLKSIGGTFDSQGEKTVINNLNGLANRIKQANQNYTHKASLKTSTEHWIKQKGVNLVDIHQQVNNVQEQQKKMALLQSIQEQKQLKDNPLEPTYKDMSLDDFSFQCEENLAYRAIILSLNSQKATNRMNPMKKMIKSNFKKISGRQQNASQSKTISLDDQQSIEETIERYGQLVSHGNPHTLHEQFYTTFEKNSQISKKWIPLMCCQIAMALNFQDEIHSPISPKNYLASISIQGLERVFKERLEHQRLQIIAGYNQGEESLEQQSSSWRQMYFLLRSGEKTKFIELIQGQDKSVAQNIQLVLDQLQQFKKGVPYLSDIFIDPHMNIYQRIIKMVAINKFQSLFDRCDVSNISLDEPWLILMILGLSSDHLNEKTREKEFIKAVNRYFTQAKRKLMEDLNGENIINFVIGLMALGKYQLLFRLYDEIEQQLRKNHICIWIQLVHLFILLLSNSTLVYLQNKDNQSEEIINKCVEQIVKYLCYLKDQQYMYEFNSYTLLLSSSLGNLERQKDNFSYKELIDRHCSYLFQSIEEINLIDLDKLSKDTNKASKYFLQNILNNLSLYNEEDYLKLAERCGQIGLYDLQEHLFVELIIFNYNNQEQQSYPQQQFFNVNIAGQRNKNNLVEQVETYLTEIMKKEDIQVLAFFKKLRQLRTLILHRKKEDLQKNQEDFAKYSRNFEVIMNYLSKIDPFNVKGIQDVFVHYIKLLLDMYRIIYLSERQRKTLTQKKQQLIDALNTYKRQYPKLSQEAVGKVIELLRQ